MVRMRTGGDGTERGDRMRRTRRGMRMRLRLEGLWPEAAAPRAELNILAHPGISCSSLACLDLRLSGLASTSGSHILPFNGDTRGVLTNTSPPGSGCRWCRSCGISAALSVLRSSCPLSLIFF